MKYTVSGIVFGALALLSLVLTPMAHGQTYRYSATTGDVTLSAATTKFTIQQPATNAKQVTLETAVLYCSVACDITQAQNGTAATATAGTASPVLPIGPAATATVWTASNAANGTAAGGILHLAAGERVTVDLSKVRLGNAGTGTNYTFAVASVTGTVNLTIFWSEI